MIPDKFAYFHLYMFWFVSDISSFLLFLCFFSRCLLGEDLKSHKLMDQHHRSFQNFIHVFISASRFMLNNPRLLHACERVWAHVWVTLKGGEGYFLPDHYVCLNLYDGLHPSSHSEQSTLLIRFSFSGNICFICIHIILSFHLQISFVVDPSANQCLSIRLSVWQVERWALSVDSQDRSTLEIAQTKVQRWVRVKFKVSSCPLPLSDHRL